MNRQNRKLHRTVWCFWVNWRHRKLEQVPHKVVFRNMNRKKAFYHETPPYIHGLLQLKMHINLYKTIKEEMLFHKNYQQWQFIYFPLVRATFTIFTRLKFENNRCLALRHLMELASSQGCLWAPQDTLLCKFDLHNVSQNTCIDIYFAAYQIGGSETVICPRSPFWNISFKLWIQRTEHSTTQTQIYNEREIFFQSVPADCQCPKTDFQFGNLLQTELG